MLGNCEAWLGQCWARGVYVGPYVEPVAAYVGPMVGHLVGFVGFHGGFWREKITPNGKACPLRVILGHFLGLCQANVGPFWDYVGPMVGHLVGFMGFHGGFWREKITPNGKACALRVILGHLLRLCRANVEPFWVYVGPTLGHLMGFLGFHGAFCGQKKTYGKLVLLRVFWGCFLPP